MKADKRLWMGGMLAASLGLCGMAMAQTTSTPESTPQQTNPQSSDAAQSDDAPGFSQLDKNADHKLERSEIPTAMHTLRARFRSYDTDKDGRLSPAEYSMFAHPPHRVGVGS